VSVTFKDWDSFCKFAAGFACYRVDQISDLPDHTSNWIVIKHDIEADVEKALRVARIEAQYGIMATYYVQLDLMTNDNASIWREIQRLGHEVTYHYDVLDACNGDLARASAQFAEAIARFNNLGFEVRTVCPHGNPMLRRSGWSSNKDFFRSKDNREVFSTIFDLVVDGKRKIRTPYHYISDAGYSWKVVADIENNDRVGSNDRKLEGLSEIQRLLIDGNCLIVSSHPHRFSKSLAGLAIRVALFRVARVMARIFAGIPGVRNLLSRLYKYSRFV